jgi:hypothetical protein
MEPAQGAENDWCLVVPPWVGRAREEAAGGVRPGQGGAPSHPGLQCLLFWREISSTRDSG